MADIPLAARIIRTLEAGPIQGQTELMQAVLGPQRTIAQCEGFRLALRFHLVHPIGVVEERVQLPATGHEGPPVFEYRYRLPTAAEVEASKAVVRTSQPPAADANEVLWLDEGAD